MATISYPKDLTKPVTKLLTKKLGDLKKTRKNMIKEDPFNDHNRVTDNAAPDTEADEQFGHARTAAIRVELRRTAIQIKKALARIRIGKYGVCERCGQMIDTDRLMVYPEATLCTKDARKK